MSATLKHLHRLYAATDDPWQFDTSPYEQCRFVATRDALEQRRYAAALEIGCGNGALARHLALFCARYVGMDAVGRAVDAAREKVPQGQFVVGTYPCALPQGPFDLVILSEFLYFLTPDSIAQLCGDVAQIAPRAEILCITYLGDTEQILQGVDALDLFRFGMQRHLKLEPVVNTGRFRIDRGRMA